VVNANRQFPLGYQARVVGHAEHAAAQNLGDEARFLLQRPPCVLTPDAVYHVAQPGCCVALLLAGIPSPRFDHRRDQWLVAVLNLPEQEPGVQQAGHVEIGY